MNDTDITYLKDSMGLVLSNRHSRIVWNPNPDKCVDVIAIESSFDGPVARLQGPPGYNVLLTEAALSDFALITRLG